MIQRLSSADIIVMALRAITGIYAHVVKCCISKVRDVMTISAILVIGIGWYVVSEFTHTDHIVVARITVTSDTSMIIGASAKGAWAMTKLAIICGWHVFIERCA